MRLIGKLIKLAITLVVIVAIAVVGVYVYVKNTYGIDLYYTVQDLITLCEEVDEATLCPDAFSSEDMVDLQTTVNNSVDNLITYTEQNGYVVNLETLPTDMTHLIKLTDKQVGALADVMLEQEMGGCVVVSDKEIPVKLKQMTFSEGEDGATLLNAVAALDLSAFVAMVPDSFPFSYVKPHIPNTLYVSSTVSVTKGEEAFSYTVAHSSLTLNNLTKDETENLFKTLDLLLKLGTADSLNLEVGNAIMGALVGTEDDKGVAYTLKDIGARDYEFLVEGEEIYFCVNII